MKNMALKFGKSATVGVVWVFSKQGTSRKRTILSHLGVALVAQFT